MKYLSLFMAVFCFLLSFLADEDKLQYTILGMLWINNAFLNKIEEKL